MDNNLKKIEKDLRAFAKRCKDIKYTQILLFVFLLTGLLSLAAPADSVETARRDLNTSITDMKKLFKEAKQENNKLMKGSNLELIQLMEQGDHVVKSPWSSWQYGMNYFYGDWTGTYKGRGDKKEKYPYEGILTRDENEFNRYVATNSSMYSSLATSTNPRSASTNLRKGLSNYGLASNKTVPEPPVSFEISASIKPRIVNKGAITVPAPAALQPTLPKAIDFKPVTPTVVAPTAPTVVVSTPPSISFQAQGFGQANNSIIHQVSQGIHLMNYASYNSTNGVANFDVTNNTSTLTSGSVAYTTPPVGTGISITDPSGTISTGDTMSATMNAVFSHVAPTSVTMTGDYSLNSTAGHNILFISVNPYNYYLTPGNKTFSFNGNVTLNSNGGSSVVGIEHQLLNGGGGGYYSPVNQVVTTVENNGTITLGNGQNMIGIMLDTEYYGSPGNYKFAKSPQTNNNKSIIISAGATNSVGFDYGYYVTGSSNEGPNGTVKVGTITINGNSNYGYRQKYYSATQGYYDGMGTVDGSNGVITLNGSNNVGYSIAHGKTTGDPISNITNMQVEVNGSNNVGFLRNADTSTTLNPTAITLNVAKLGNQFNFGTAATGGALIRSDINEVILDKDITVGATGVKNSLMQAGQTGTVILASGKTITSTTASEFYGMTAGGFAGAADGKKATAKNLGTLAIGGNKSLGMAIDVDDEGFNIGKINFSGTEGAGVYNTGIFTSDTASEVNVTGNNSIGVYNKGTLTTKGKIVTTSEKSTGIFSEAGTVTNTGIIDVSGKSVKAIVGKGVTTVTSTGKVTVNGTALSDTDGSVGLGAMNGATISQTNADTNITVGDSASIGLYANGKDNIPTAVTTTLKVTGGTVTAKDGAFNTYAANSGTITLDGVTLNTEQKSLAFYTTDNGKIDFGTGAMNTANIKGGTDANSRGTAFLYKGAGATYTPFTPGAILAWAGANFANLNKLTLNMEQGSRLFIAQNVAMDLTGTGPGGIAGALPGVTFTGSNDYKTFMLYLSKLTLDQNINLDDPTDAYNKLEISNSTIKNQNSKTITGTTAGQVAIAQENDTTLDRTKVQLVNEGTISLSGANSTAMYSKFGELINDGGTITIGDNSAALYGTNDSKIENINGGVINLGNGSTGIYSEGDTAAGVTNASGTFKGSVNNDGIITSTGKAIGITYKGTGTGNTDVRVTNNTNGKINLAGEGSVGIYGLGSNYKILNNGEINLGNSSSLTTNPNVGIYTATESVNIENAATRKVSVGNNSVGIYGYNVDNAGQITAGDNGIGIYSKKLSTGPSTVNHTGTITVGNNDATGIFLEDGGNLNFNSGSINVGNNSYGIVAIGSSPFNYTNNAAATVNLGNGSTYFYSNNTTTSFTNNIALNNAAGVGIYGISSPGTVINNANFTLGDQSVGILNTGTGVATNNAAIVVGSSDTGNKNYAIGMATTTGKVINSNTGSITVGADGIGLFADGANSQAENNGTINIAGDRGMGMYLDNGAKGVNNGTITTVGTPTGAVGVVVQHKAELTNNGTININSPEGYAFFKATGGVIKNYGTITLGSGATETFDPTSKPTSKTAGGISINAPTGATPATTTVTTINHGTISSIVSPEHIVINTPQGPAGPSPTSLGIYVDTLGSTNPISGNLGLVTTEADLILGAEAARTTNSKNIVVSGAILDPYVQMMAANSGVTWNAYGGSLTWIATPLYSNGQLGSVVLAKLPYTEFAGNETTPVNSTDTYNFLHGLDDRYGVDWYGDRGAREKQLFNKLNDIGKNEEALFYQATDEMMGHQYGNVQQRINETGSLLDKEFKYLRNEWRNPSKQNNKIKVFGMRNEYNTDTAGIIDYTSDAYGVAYVHEDETVKLGNSSGWYAGAVNNRFRFKDIGKSRENQTMLKAGIFKTMSPASDHNGSLRWTIAGDAFISKNEMKRKFLVVDDVFNAKGDYTSYGVALKTDLGYDIRMSERTHLRPYGALKMEYGRFNSIKEDNGEIRLEIEGNDYFSVKPEVGVEFKYVQPLAVRTQLSVGLSAAYENELGRVADGKNKARVRYTDADWFGIRGEKEDRRGSGKFDLNIGVDNTRFGVTFNAGYDTKGSNIRGGLGFRVIY